MRPLAAAGLLLALGLLSPAPAALPAPVPGGDDPTSVDWTADDAICRCRAGNACWHYLRSPVEPPGDPCWCNFCTKVSKHDGSRAMPEGWSEVCASNMKLRCFLKRHATSWGMTCSECIKQEKGEECACNNPHPGDCPRCEKGGSPWNPERVQDVRGRLKWEQEVFASKDIVIVQSPHFYVVTDIPSLKIRTQSGVYRVAGTHELAHIYAERCEKARREFVQNFTDEIGGSKPTAVYLPKRESTAGKIQSKYNGSPRTNLVYGGTDDGKMADGTCFNGFCNSLQGKGGGDDEQLHHSVRHMIGHLLISCWVKVDGKDRALPRWLFEGVAHWLAKRHPLLKDLVVWCADEGSPISGSGKDWDKEARKIASDAKSVPVERLLEKSTVGLLEYDDHVRAWSYIDLGLKEDREGLLKILRNLRAEMATRQAWMQGEGISPDEWDKRWRDRLAGRRPTFGPWTGEKVDDDGPGAAERRALRNEQDVQNLVARIRSIGTCADPRTATVLTELFARDSDAVREVLTVLLAKTTDPKSLEAIRTAGLGSQNPVVRAFAARVLGMAGDAGSLDPLRKQVADDFWLARAEAALALMRLKDPKIADSVRPLIADQAAKVRIAAMDAAATGGQSAEKVVAEVARNLDHDSWQVRSAAAESLGGIGSMLGVDALIARMTTEAGRIRVDCHAALKAITRDDLGKNPEQWAKWWKRERERVGGGIPDAPKGGDFTNPDDARYAPPPQRPYGIQSYEGRVGYMLDMSNSMFNYFDPDPAEVKRLRRKYTGATKFDISKEEIVQSIAELDPRAKFNVMVFSTKARLLGSTMLPAGGDSSKKAESFLKSCRSDPAAGGGAAPQLTSFYDAFRSVFDMPKGSTLPSSNFTETPDTMFFLTDGEPTAGEIIDADELLAWFNGLNRYARIRVHVVAYGNMGIDLVFLGHLAGDNGGKLINIAEAKGSAGTGAPPTTPK